MTTTKKSLLAILMLVFVCVCCFTSVASAEIATVADFEEKINILIDKGVEPEELFDDYKDVQVLREATNIYTDLTLSEKNSINAAIAAKYEAYRQVSSEAFKADAYITSTLYDKLNNIKGRTVLLSDEDDIAAIEATIAGLDAKANAWVKQLNGYANIALAKARIADIKVAVANAIAKINAIDYFTIGGRDIIALASEESIDEATEALDAIFGADFDSFRETEGVFVTNLAKYDAAVEALAAQYAKAEAVIDAAKAVYAKIVIEDGERIVYWTLKEEIADVVSMYDDLADDADFVVPYNDLQAIVDEDGTLDEMLAVLAAIQAEIDVVEDLIDAIGTVEYTTGDEDAIAAAREAFNALDADLVAADIAAQAASEATSVENYDALVKAEEKMAFLQARYEELIAKIDAMALAFQEHGDIFDAYPALQALYLTVDTENPEMILALELEVYDDEYEVENYNKAIANYKEAYDFYAARALEVLANVTSVIKAIDELPNPVVLNVEHQQKLALANSLYNALSEEDKKFVENYEKLVLANEQFDAAMAIADNWVAKVNAIGVVEATDASIARVEDAVSAWDKLDAAAQAVVASLSKTDAIWGEYAVAYETYTAATTRLAALLNAIEIVADAMDTIVTTNIPDSEVAAFVATIADIKAAYNMLPATSKTYLQENYTAQYQKYLAGVRNSEKYLVEQAIKAIPDDVTIADRFLVYNADSLAKAYIAGYGADATNPALVETVYIRNYDKLVAAKADLKELTDALDVWANAVKALVGGNYDNIDKIVADKDAYPIDLDKAVELYQQYMNYNADEKSYFLDDLVDDFAMLNEIGANAVAQAEAVEAKMAALNAIALDKLTNANLDAIEATAEAYNDLHASQKELVDADIKAAFDERVEKLAMINAIEAVIDGLANSKDITSDTPIMIELLKAVYGDLDTNDKKLIDNWGKLADIEKAYNAAVANGTVVSVTNLKASVEALKAALNTKDAELAAAIQAAEDKIAILDAQLGLTEDALEEVEKDLATANKNVETLQGTLTAIIIIFSILIAACVVAIVILLLKKKA